MIPAALSALIGCLSAMIAMAEINHPNKLIRYSLALLLGVIVAILLAMLLGWITSKL